MTSVRASWKGLDRLKAKLHRLPLAVQEELRPTLRAGAQIVADDIARSMRESKTGRVYQKRGVRYTASAPGESPAVFSGRLIGSSKIEDDVGPRPAVRLRVTGAQAMALEFGSVRSAARPFLFPAVNRNKKKVSEEIRSKAKASLRKIARGRG